MNKRYVSLFFTFLVSFGIFANPRENVIVVDMDEVFVDPKLWDIGTHILKTNIFNIPSFSWNILTNSKFRKRFRTIIRNDNNQPQIGHGFTFKMAAIARLHKPFRSSYDTILKSVHNKRTLDYCVIRLFRKLKDQGYTIIVATNRDRIGFEITAKKLKFDQLYNGKRLFDKVIVSENTDFVKATTVKSKRFSKLNYDQKLNDYITVAAGYKPNKDYYQVVRDVVNTYTTEHQEQFDTSSPHIIFFDDKQENVNGANSSNLDITAYQVPAKERALSMQNNLKQCCAIVTE